MKSLVVRLVASPFLVFSIALFVYAMGMPVTDPLVTSWFAAAAAAGVIAIAIVVVLGEGRRG